MKHSEKNTGPNQVLKPAGQAPDYASPCLLSKVSSHYPTPFSVVDCNTFFLSLSSDILERYSMALVSPKSCSLQANLGFTFAASHIGLCEPPCRDTPATFLALVSFLSQRGRFHNPFILSLTLKSDPQG